MSQSLTDSLTTIEDSTLYEGVYRVGVSREEIYGDEQSQVSDTVRTSTRRLPIIMVASRSVGRSARPYAIAARHNAPGW
jgi:hypothetical protein